MVVKKWISIFSSLFLDFLFSFYNINIKIKMSENKYYDEVCDKHFSSQSALNKHLKAPSHLKKIKLKEYEKFENEDDEAKIPKEFNMDKVKFTELNIKKNYYCPLCDYQNPRQTNFSKHTSSKLHYKNIDTYEENGGSKELRKQLENLDIFIGLFKGKQITKDDVKKEFEIEKYMKEPTEEEKDIKLKKEHEDNIKAKEDAIISQEKYIKKLEKMKNLMIEDLQGGRANTFQTKRIEPAKKVLNKFKLELKQLKKE